MNDLHLNERECDRDDYSYTYAIAGEGEEIQWELMAKDGVIAPDEAVRHATADTAIAKARLAQKRPSRMSDVNRLKFMRTLTLHGWTPADLANTGVPPNRGFAQRLLDDAAACPG